MSTCEFRRTNSRNAGGLVATFIMSNGAHFTFNGNVNKQNWQFYATENPLNVWRGASTWSKSERGISNDSKKDAIRHSISGQPPIIFKKWYNQISLNQIKSFFFNKLFHLVWPYLHITERSKVIRYNALSFGGLLDL